MIVIAVILYATLNDNPLGADELPIFPGADKVIHAIMFGGLFSAISFDRFRDGRGMTVKSHALPAEASTKSARIRSHRRAKAMSSTFLLMPRAY